MNPTVPHDLEEFKASIKKVVGIEKGCMEE
jgi:hypothetical protein